MNSNSAFMTIGNTISAYSCKYCKSHDCDYFTIVNIAIILTTTMTTRLQLLHD